FVLVGAPSGQKAPELTLSIWGELGLDFWFGPDTYPAGGNHMLVNFSINPSLNWQVWNNGSINFEYNLGSSDITRNNNQDYPARASIPVLDTNKFTTKFKWTL
ncbi:MAG: hypothetical protein LBG94_07560, partial [Treponema sp.]|nr:hypothetical protein [Treponema sp.]